MDQFHSFLTDMNVQLVTLIQPRQLASRAVHLGSTWVTHFACVDWIRGGHSKLPETSDTVINRHLLNIYWEPSSRLRVKTPVQLCEPSPPALNNKVTLPRGENPGRGGVGWKPRNWKSWGVEGRHQLGQPGGTCRQRCVWRPRPRLPALWMPRGRRGDQRFFPKRKSDQKLLTSPHCHRPTSGS